MPVKEKEVHYNKIIMTNDELKSILEWINQRGKFMWSDLQSHFEYKSEKMALVQNALRSNMPASNNLVDHSYVSGENPNILVLTSNGRNLLTSLKNSLPQNTGIVAGGSVTSGGDIIVGGKKIIGEKQPFKNYWYQKPVGIVILTVIAGLIISGIIYLLGWN